MQTDNPTEQDGLRTLDEKTFSPPATRIGTVAGVRSRISELKAGDAVRSNNRAEIDGLIDGNAPYIQEDMDSSGRGDDANFNDRSAEGMVDAATTPYYELKFGVDKAVQTEIYYTDAEGKTNKKRCAEYAKKFDNRFTKMLWGWPGYKTNCQISDAQTVIYGRGPLVWQGKRGWQFEAKRDDQVLVADDTMCDLDKLTEVAIPGHFNPVELFRKVNNKIEADSEGRKNGWDYDVAMEAIINAAPESLKESYGDLRTSYQDSLRRGDVDWSNKQSRIYYTSFLVKEFNGKISHVIVLDNYPPNNTGLVEHEKFLYKKVNKFDSFHQVLNPMFFSVPRDGMWYSVKGLGPKIYDVCDAFNRLNCTLLNGAMAGCGVAMKAKSAQALQKLSMTPTVRAQGTTWYPPDWEFAPSNVAPRLDGPLAIKRDFQNTLQSNTGQYRQRVSEENQEPTLGQAQLNATQQATLNRGSFDRHYDQFDDVLKEIVRRALDPGITEDDPGGKEAKELIRCLTEEDEIPEDVLKFENFVSIKARRNVGRGSAQMEQIIGQQLMGAATTMDEEGRNNAYRFWGAGLVGPSNIDEFYKPFEELGIPNDQEAWATVENNILRQPGAQLVVTPGMNHPTHFITHYKDMVQHVQQVEQGGDPRALVIHLDQGGPHNQMHLNQMIGDPTRKEQVEQFVKMHMGLARIADKIKKQVAQMPPEGNGQPQIDPADMKDLMKLTADIKLKEVKQMADDERKNRKLKADMERKDLTTSANIMRRNAETFAQPNGQEMTV